MSRLGFIFLHGFLGRAETKLAGITFEYFRGLRDVATEFGIELAVPQMPHLSGIDDRAESVRSILEKMQAEKVAIVGNSMGGLVARALAVRHDHDKRIRVVASVCTPHWGSPIADRTLAGESRIPDFVVAFLEDAVSDLSVMSAETFNDATPDRPDVTYLSWAAARPNDEMPFWFKKREAYIFEREGENDGLVSVASARWGTFVEKVRADHIETIGWSPAPADPGIGRPFDQVALWRRVIERCQSEA